MKRIIETLIADFQERKLPAVFPRATEFPVLEGKATAVIGMRRTGKTYYCYQQIHRLRSDGIPKEQILYLNFEDDRLLGFELADFQTVLDLFYGLNPELKSRTCYFFLDEIQVVPMWEKFIRRLLDTESIQVCITGSSSKMLSSEIATSLRGRSISVEIFPYSFDEYLRAKEVFKEIPHQLSTKTKAHLRHEIREYLESGGFPEVMTCSKTDRVGVLQNYIDTVMFKDVIERHGVKNPLVIRYLIQQVMSQPGSLFSVNKFYNSMRSQSVSCTKNHLYDYINHLTEAFLFFKVPVHSRSSRVQMGKPDKLYCIDTGLLNVMTYRNSENAGPILETLVFLALRRKGMHIEYVLNDQGSECDFYFKDPLNNEVRLVQVCWELGEEKTRRREFRGLQLAMKSLGFDTGTIVTWDREEEMKDDVRVVPLWKWLLEYVV